MEDEMEKFEITDYDLENEFNINRPRRGLSKQQQIYGNIRVFLSKPQGLFKKDTENECNMYRNMGR